MGERVLLDVEREREIYLLVVGHILIALRRKMTSSVLGFCETELLCGVLKRIILDIVT